MQPGDARWVEVSPSQFTHETEGLAIVRALLPSQPPFRAWSNFEFRDGRGRWHEVDLLVLGRGRLHLVELKHYYGRLRGDDHTWLREGGRAGDSPLKLARRKAQYLKTKLEDAFRTWVREKKNFKAPGVRDVVPFIQESVFLHHDQFRSELSPASAIGLYGIDGHTAQTNLPGLSDLLLEPADPRQKIFEPTLVELMKRIGLVQRRQREAGSWVIENEPIDSGDGWQDWQGFHRVSQQERGRIRIRIPAPGSGEEERQRLRTLAAHEYRVVGRLTHKGVLRPRDLVESELGVGLVYPHEEGWQRLDLWRAEQAGPVPLETALAVVRQVGEALAYAHGNRVVHRGLGPLAIWLREHRGALRVQVRDWQSAGEVAAQQTATAVGAGVTGLLQVDEPRSLDTWLTEGFAAPEGALGAGVDRVRVDVFGLGALAFYLLAGQPAARSTAALRTRLREQSGLDLAPEVPQVSGPLRAAVLRATRSAVSERTPDVASFLADLTAEEQRDTDHEPAVDPLEAVPGMVLDGRFKVSRRLGQGSTAVGLLVGDPADDTAPKQVLKVALDEAAGRRLGDEADVLRTLRSPRLVRLVDGPLTLGDRAALLLESAGEETLQQAMSGRGRLSLDLLERWGRDLLEAVVALDQAGVDHRDIKPANLGVREDSKYRTKHLVLFDFSLARAPGAAILAGTPPYLDPFLGTDGRDRYDSAAERYAAAVVLYEMATGTLPCYGDGVSDPASIAAEADIQAKDFDPTIAPAMVTFFRAALARRVEERPDTAGQLLSSWQRIFGSTDTEEPDDAADLIAAATPATPLRDAGLSARALSALEPLGLATVGDLVAVDPVLLSRMRGVAEHTRKQIRAAATAWRTAFRDSIRQGRRGGDQRDLTLPEPQDAADRLTEAVRGGRASPRPALVGHILGVTGAVDAFATQAQLGAHLPDPVSGARVNQLVADLQETWAGDPATRELLLGLGVEVDRRLAELGGLATVDELADHLLTRMVADPQTAAARETRLGAGLVRLALDRQRAVVRGQDEGQEYGIRRRDGRPVLVGTSAEALDAAEGLGRVADQLVAGVNLSGRFDQVVPPIRVAEALTAAVRSVPDAAEPLRDPVRLARLAAALSTRAAASATSELHHRELPAATALALTLSGVAAGQRLMPAEVRDRVRARFPALAPLPERPRLDELVREAGLDLAYDVDARAYQTRTGGRDTTGLESRPPTAVLTELPVTSVRGAIGQRLADSVIRRSFLALGAPALALDRLIAVLTADHDAAVLDVTAVLVAAMREQAGQVGLPWATVRQADAQPAGSRDAQGLLALVARALPELDAAIDTALSAPGSGPVVLVDAAPLARYGAVARLNRWTDLAAPRPRALWLVVPQLHANQGAVLDGKPLPLAAPGQFVPVGADWIGTRSRAAQVKEGVAR